MKPWGIHVCNLNPAFMNTPMIGKSIESSREELRNAPEEVRSQYPEDVMDGGAQMILKIQEDPSKVVSCALYLSCFTNSSTLLYD